MKASDRIFNEMGFDVLDLEFNVKRLNLQKDQDYKILMAEALETSNKWFADKDEKFAAIVCKIREGRLKKWEENTSGEE